MGEGKVSLTGFSADGYVLVEFEDKTASVKGKLRLPADFDHMHSHRRCVNGQFGLEY